MLSYLNDLYDRPNVKDVYDSCKDFDDHELHQEIWDHVKDFNYDMLEQLLINKDKDLTWHTDSIGSLLNHLDEEVDELYNQVEYVEREKQYYPSDLLRIVDEAADVANIAMMIADKARHKISELKKKDGKSNN